MEKVGVIGLGKLGLPLAAIHAKHFKVYGVDLSKSRIKQIESREEFFEPQVNEYLEKYGQNLEVSTNYDNLKECDVVFIITQTPSLQSGRFDLRYVESAIKELHKVNPNCLAVVSSTINIGDTDKLHKIHRRIAYNPEFIKQGSIIHDFENPKFVLVGAYNKKDGKVVADIWHKHHNKPVHIVKPIEAEIIKLSLNVSFTLGIIFANIIGELCERFGADSNKVLDIIYQDRRNYKPGLGYAGPCFPRDVNCFKATALENSVESAYRLASLLNDLNSYIIEKQIRKIKSFDKKKIGFLGVAYKPNVPYTYDSQPLQIATKLAEEGFEIHIYDPIAEEDARKKLPQAIFHENIESCIRESDVLFVGTSNFTSTEADKPIINPWS
jgi:nucleotide sugar dehydrogenase